MNDLQRLREDVMFRQWEDSLRSNRIRIKDVRLLGKVHRGGCRRYFVDSELIMPGGGMISRCILLSGRSVLIVPVLRCPDDGETYTLMVEQRRVADGACSLEFPAGDLDAGRDPVSMACQELREELNLDLRPDELKPLAEQPIQINPSYSDIAAYFYYFERDAGLEYLRSINGSDAGCHGEDEYIKIRVRRMAEVAAIPGASAIIGIKLLEKALMTVFHS